MRRVRTIAGDSANVLLYRELGRSDDEVEEAFWLVNPGLAEHGAALPSGLWVNLPELASKPAQAAPITAWD
ncbi:tail protein X [Pseudomonas aeruginosa]|uniref:tail protein X n=1 Tax=Pseudomonas aeruginosa TaxID=287 RepID=UPI00053ED396|nr:tail protein X [Pseudomonas aeruginosa]EKV4055994.1 tail protein X [Pseudomonas aeruginosa]ELM1746583.1 tail protein X [Pseudomonas aeruginosa]MBV6203220.1 tail protein X [Pseudomonas aeruginosa]NQB40272.1 phage tail protein [Pseudomonas aeruginosa]OKQ98123.1 phage tail protein [Pseudomonas aeruginosa]